MNIRRLVAGTVAAVALVLVLLWVVPAGPLAGVLGHRQQIAASAQQPQVSTAATLPAFTTPVAVPTPTESGAVSSGDTDCAFSTNGGNGTTVYVTVQNVENCTQVSSALASFGQYWNPLIYSGFVQDQADGTGPTDADSYCLLDGNGGEIMDVYGVGGYGSSLPGQICQAEEQNGWSATQNGA